MKKLIFGNLNFRCLGFGYRPIPKGDTQNPKPPEEHKSLMDQVRKLLKRKLQEHHPDKGHDPSEKVATHAELVHTINELLELLPRNAEADSVEAVESWRRRAMAAEERNAELESRLAGKYDDDGEDLEVSSSRDKLIYNWVDAYR